MLKKLTFTMALSLAFTGTALAQDDDGWAGDVSLTGGLTTGNTDTQDLALGFKVAKIGEKWNHTLDGLADFGRVDDVQTRERYALGYKIDRNISDRFFAYGNADWYSDEFGPFRDGYYVGGGLGYKVVLPEPIGWTIEGGPGFRSQRTQSTLAQVFGADGITPVLGADGLPSFTGLGSERSNEFALRGFSDFDYALNENVSLYNDTEIIWSSSDTYIWNEIGLNAQLFGDLAARISYRVDHHTDVVDPLVNTDTSLRFGLVYTVK